MDKELLKNYNVIYQNDIENSFIGFNISNNTLNILQLDGKKTKVFNIDLNKLISIETLNNNNVSFILYNDNTRTYYINLGNNTMANNFIMKINSCIIDYNMNKKNIEHNIIRNL